MFFFSIEDVFNYNNYQYILLSLGYKYLVGLINCACVQKEVILSIVRYLIWVHDIVRALYSIVIEQIDHNDL